MKNYFANVYNKLMSRFTIKTKILIIVLVNTILILTIFGIVIKIQSDEIFNNINTQEKLRLKALNNSLDHYKKLIHDYSEIISHNENVEQELFFQKTKGTFEQYKIKKLIYPIFKTIKVDYLTIYDTNKTVMLRGHNLNHFNDKIINDNILNKTLKNENHHTLIMQNPSNNKFVLMSYNPVHFNNQIVGACSVGFNMDYHFLNKLEKLVGNKLLLSLNGKIISRSFLESPTTNNIPKDFNLKLDYLNVGTIPIIDIKDGVYKTINYDASYMHLATHKVLKSVGFYLLTDNNKLKNHIQTLQTVSIFIIILIIITTVILTYLFAHNIKIHVQKVVQGFKKLAHGDLSTNLEITSQDEMGQLSISFNSLAKQLKMHIESLDTLVEQRTIELKDSEERYRTLFDTSPDGIIVHDETGILYANKAAADLVGTDNPDKHIGQSVFGFVPPEYQEIVKERVTNIMKGLTDTEQRLDIKLNRLDGTVIDIETISTSFYNKGKRAILAIIRDITERKKAERALQESEARYRTLIETSPIGIAVNIKGKIVYINKSAAKIMEIDDIESIIGRDITDFVHPDYRELSRKRMMDIMENMTTVPSIEMKFIKLDGKIIDVESISTFITYKGKSAMVSIFSDITEKKRIERLREDTELIVKHDLKSPLSGIIGFSELLLQDKKLTKEQSEWISMIYNNSNTMIHRIDQSFDIFKMEEGSYKLEPEEFDLIQMFRKLDVQFEQYKKARSNKINYMFNDRNLIWNDSYTMMGEPIHLECLFANLIKNAFEASPEAKDITISIHTNGVNHKIDIHNFGSIPKNIQHKFFERYVTHGKPGGTGIGTYSAKLIAKVHGGDITFTTSENEGTHLNVVLPKKLPVY